MLYIYNSKVFKSCFWFWLGVQRRCWFSMVFSIATYPPECAASIQISNIRVEIGTACCYGGPWAKCRGHEPSCPSNTAQCLVTSTRGMWHPQVAQCPLSLAKESVPTLRMVDTQRRDVWSGMSLILLIMLLTSLASRFSRTIWLRSLFGIVGSNWMRRTTSHDRVGITWG